MEIELLLNPKADYYVDFISDFENELRSLKGLKYKQTEAPAPPKTLNVVHDVVKLVFDHGADALRVVVVLLQLAQAVAERRKRPEEGKKGQGAKEPIAVLKVDDRTVTFPATDRAQRTLLEAVRKGKTKKAKRKRSIPRKKQRKARRKGTQS